MRFGSSAASSPGGACCAYAWGVGLPGMLGVPGVSFHGEEDITNLTMIPSLSPPVSLLTSEHPVEKEALS